MSLFASMFDALGDRIALQYGGSEANKKVTKQYRKDGGGADGGATTSGDSTSGSPGHAKATAQTAYVHSGAGGAEFLTSLKRYYNNVTKDALKQVQCTLRRCPLLYRWLGVPSHYPLPPLPRTCVPVVSCDCARMQ